ncbi:MAG: hypothetical protein ABJF11_06880 [Reichenbachiella sp.]|uniref:hypothetical protein n=1 Tax=Reichenbachiella sp. TaxID=2184521 RepID=UPI0032674E16
MSVPFTGSQWAVKALVEWADGLLATGVAGTVRVSMVLEWSEVPVAFSARTR